MMKKPSDYASYLCSDLDEKEEAFEKAEDSEIVIDGHSLTIEQVVEVSRFFKKVRISDLALKFVNRGSRLVSDWSKQGQRIYGITTGFGDLSKVSIPPEQCSTLQTNLLISHACGVGKPYSVTEVRAMMLLRANALLRGFSGVTEELVQRIVDYLNLGIHPLVPSQGSVGASGDLCPLAHIGVALIGLGEVFFRGETLLASEVLNKLGLQELQMQPKEALALTNGTCVMSALACIAIYDAAQLLKVADIASAMSLEAMHGVPYAFDPKTHELRDHPGQKKVAQNILSIIQGSEIIERYKNDRVQDAYSLRCIPQVHGASRDLIDYVIRTVSIEINSVTDNPIIFPSEGLAISGGNFHGQPIALAMDCFGIAISEIADISERRLARIVDGKISGLPPFLIEESGINSGFMVPQYVAASLVSENKVLSHPSSVDSIPTSAMQEDHVSMGGFSARKAIEILGNTQKVVAIELLATSQALDFSNPLSPGKGCSKARKIIREEIPFIVEDVYFAPIIEKVIDLVVSNKILTEVEKEIGPLN